jgi:hypothetical protein
MGKAADNERLKLDAAFYNNLAVGLFVGGAFLPAFGIYQNIPFADLLSGHPPSKYWGIVIGTIFSFLLAWLFRTVALDKLKKIKD